MIYIMVCVVIYCWRSWLFVLHYVFLLLYVRYASYNKQYVNELVCVLFLIRGGWKRARAYFKIFHVSP